MTTAICEREMVKAQLANLKEQWGSRECTLGQLPTAAKVYGVLRVSREFVPLEESEIKRLTKVLGRCSSDGQMWGKYYGQELASKWTTLVAMLPTVSSAAVEVPHGEC